MLGYYKRGAEAFLYSVVCGLPSVATINVVSNTPDIDPTYAILVGATGFGATLLSALSCRMLTGLDALVEPVEDENTLAGTDNVVELRKTG